MERPGLHHTLLGNIAVVCLFKGCLTGVRGTWLGSMAFYSIVMLPHYIKTWIKVLVSQKDAPGGSETCILRLVENIAP